VTFVIHSPFRASRCSFDNTLGFGEIEHSSILRKLETHSNLLSLSIHERIDEREANYFVRLFEPDQLGDEAKHPARVLTALSTFVGAVMRSWNARKQPLARGSHRVGRLPR
jgi:hypothetical protein